MEFIKGGQSETLVDKFSNASRVPIPRLVLVAPKIPEEVRVIHISSHPGIFVLFSRVSSKTGTSPFKDLHTSRSNHELIATRAENVQGRVCLVVKPYRKPSVAMAGQPKNRLPATIDMKRNRMITGHPQE
jgi:hypothetical protein|tara:strand:- start:4145 stop:4534 length:390 start_codon:yes stop_codon:yes gene_type:complete